MTIYHPGDVVQITTTEVVKLLECDEDVWQAVSLRDGTPRVVEGRDVVRRLSPIEEQEAIKIETTGASESGGA